MVSGAMPPRLAVADMPTNAITKTALFLRLMIGLLFMNWRRGGRDLDQLDPNEAAFAKSRLNENSFGCVAAQHNYIAVHCLMWAILHSRHRGMGVVPLKA